MATAIRFQAGVLKEANGADWMELVNTARCLRCGGLMVTEGCFYFLSDTGHLDFLPRRCVQCGEIVDPVVLRNRRRRVAATQKTT